MIDTAKIADAEQQAELATLQRELSIAENQLRRVTDKCEQLLTDNEDLSEKLSTRISRGSESGILTDRLNTLRSQLREAERSRDRAAADAAELRAVMQQYVDQIQTIEAAISPDEHEALKQELKMVREQSRKDLQDLQDQLDEQTNRSTGVDSDSVIEIEALRQEHGVITRSLSDRESELQNSQQTCQLLEDELEDAHTEIDELRRQLEQKAEELDKITSRDEGTSETVEEMLAENIHQDEEIEQAVPPIMGIKPSGGSGLFSMRTLMLLIIGAGIAIGALEAVSFNSGKGELFKRLSGQNATEVIKIPVPVTELPEKNVNTPDHSAKETLSGQIVRD